MGSIERQKSEHKYAGSVRRGDDDTQKNRVRRPSTGTRQVSCDHGLSVTRSKRVNGAKEERQYKRDRPDRRVRRIQPEKRLERMTIEHQRASSFTAATARSMSSSEL